MVESHVRVCSWESLISRMAWLESCNIHLYWFCLIGCWVWPENIPTSSSWSLQLLQNSFLSLTGLTASLLSFRMSLEYSCISCDRIIWYSLCASKHDGHHLLHTVSDSRLPNWQPQEITNNANIKYHSQYRCSWKHLSQNILVPKYVSQTIKVWSS